MDDEKVLAELIRQDELVAQMNLWPNMDATTSTKYQEAEDEEVDYEIRAILGAHKLLEHLSPVGPWQVAEAYNLHHDRRARTNNPQGQQSRSANLETISDHGRAQAGSNNATNMPRQRVRTDGAVVLPQTRAEPGGLMAHEVMGSASNGHRRQEPLPSSTSDTDSDKDMRPGSTLPYMRDYIKDTRCPQPHTTAPTRSPQDCSVTCPDRNINLRGLHDSSPLQHCESRQRTSQAPLGSSSRYHQSGAAESPPSRIGIPSIRGSNVADRVDRSSGGSLSQSSNIPTSHLSHFQISRDAAGSRAKLSPVISRLPASDQQIHARPPTRLITVTKVAASATPGNGAHHELRRDAAQITAASPTYNAGYSQARHRNVLAQHPGSPLENISMLRANVAPLAQRGSHAGNPTRSIGSSKTIAPLLQARAAPLGGISRFRAGPRAQPFANQVSRTGVECATQIQNSFVQAFAGTYEPKRGQHVRLEQLPPRNVDPSLAGLTYAKTAALSAPSAVSRRVNDERSEGNYDVVRRTLGNAANAEGNAYSEPHR